MLIVDRTDFLAWTEGILLERHADGSMVIGDKVEHEAAEEALARGETVGCTINGQLVSTLSFDGRAFVEKPWNPH